MCALCVCQTALGNKVACIRLFCRVQCSLSDFLMCFLTLFKCITTQPRYANMSKALNESGRHIALNMCRGDLHPWSYIDAYAQSWRVTEDHTGKWSMPAHGIKQGIATALQISREATGKPYVRAPLPCVNCDVVASRY